MKWTNRSTLPAADCILEVDNLSVGYGGREIVKGISFTVSEGSFVGIIGPNGSGKTTLFRTITRFLQPWKGTVLYRGKNIGLISRRELAREVAVMPQSIETSFSFGIEEFIALGRFPHLGYWQRPGKKDRLQVERVMALTDTLDFKSKRLTELSGGEKQRVFLAQALAQDPKLLLLDEPTSHLDIGHQIKILDVIRSLNSREGLTVVVVLHDLNLASMYCDRLILLDKGCLFRQGTPSEVITYSNIEAVYNTVVLVHENPMTGKPHVLLVPKEKII